MRAFNLPPVDQRISAAVVAVRKSVVIYEMPFCQIYFFAEHRMTTYQSCVRPACTNDRFFSLILASLSRFELLM